MERSNERLVLLLAPCLPALPVTLRLVTPANTHLKIFKSFTKTSMICIDDRLVAISAYALRASCPEFDSRSGQVLVNEFVCYEEKSRVGELCMEHADFFQHYDSPCCNLFLIVSQTQ